MSDTYSSGEGCADSVTSSSLPQGGFENPQTATSWAVGPTQLPTQAGQGYIPVQSGVQGTAVQGTAVQGYVQGPMQAPIQGMDQFTGLDGGPVAYAVQGNGQSFSQTSAPQNGLTPTPSDTNGFYTAPVVEEHSCGGESPSAVSSGSSPVAGQPTEVSGQWHDSFHLKPANGYAYAGVNQTKESVTPAYPTPPVYPQPAYSQPAQGPALNPSIQQPMYGGLPAMAGVNGMGNPSVAPQMMTGYAPTPPIPPASGMAQGPQFFQAPPPPQAPQGPQVFAPPVSEPVGGQGHCKGNCSHHKGGDASASGAAGFGDSFNPFTFLSSIGGMGAFGGLGETKGEAFGPQAGTENPQHLEMKYGQLLEIYNDVMAGKTDPAKIINFLSSTGTYFWKGAAVGAVLTLLLTNDAVKSTLKECFSGLMPSKN